MKFSRLAFAVASVCVLSGGALAAQAQAPAGDAARGKAIFARVGCYTCHGFEGQGGVGPKLAPGPVRAWPVFSTFVRTTSRDMPPFTTRNLTDQELADIYAYLTAVPASPAPASIPLLMQLGGRSGLPCKRALPCPGAPLFYAPTA